MKRLLLISLLFSIGSIAYANASDVELPVNHVEVKPYPGEVEIILNGEKGLHNNVAYKMTCHINNPSTAQASLTNAVTPRALCSKQWGCGVKTLNNHPTKWMLNLQPGDNVYVYEGLITASMYPNSKLHFTNYSNHTSIFIDSCKAELQ